MFPVSHQCKQVKPHIILSTVPFALLTLLFFKGTPTLFAKNTVLFLQLPKHLTNTDLADLIRLD